MAMLSAKHLLSSLISPHLPRLSAATFPHITFFKLSQLSISDAANNDTPTATSKLQPKISEFLLKECGLCQSDLSAMIRKGKVLANASIDIVREAVQLLRDSGFTEEQVRKTITRYPVVLVLKTDRQLKPKIDLFQTLGITGKDLGNIISKGPRLLGCNINKTLNPNIQYLQNLFGSIDTVSTDLGRASRILLCRDGPQIWEMKLKYLASFGLHEDEIKGLVRRFPAVLEITMDKMGENMDFLIHTAQLPANIILRYPVLLFYSVEGRLKLRLRVLKSKSAMQPFKRPPNLVSVFQLNNQNFLDKYVKCSPDAIKLFEIHSGKSVHLDMT